MIRLWSGSAGKNLGITSRGVIRGDIETMNDYKEISIENYCIQELECRCNDCNNQFSDYMTLNYELVCFEDVVGKKFFLPTYGIYGYLYLLEDLVDEWNANDKITKNVTEKFEKKLSEITQHDVTIYNKVRCPFCKKYNVFINKRNTLVNCPINWLKINISKI